MLPPGGDLVFTLSAQPGDYNVGFIDALSSAMVAAGTGGNPDAASSEAQYATKYTTAPMWAAIRSLPAHGIGSGWAGTSRPPGSSRTLPWP